MVPDSNQPLITVMTPTYNRASTIPALAKSLEAQTFTDFEWLVIDDGSTDETAAVLSGIASSSSLRITIIRTPNGGKHRAINRGVREANGRWFYIVDSDDRVPADALQTVAAAIPQAEANPQCAGILALQRRIDGDINGSMLPAAPRFQTTVQLYFLGGVTGDKAWVHKTAILLAHPFPEFDGERFLTEAVVWNRIAREGLTMLLLNEIIYECEYRPDGLSARSLELRVGNPHGAMLYYSEQLLLELPLGRLVKPAINLVRFIILSRGHIIDEVARLSRGKLLTLVVLPVAAILALRDSLKLRRND